MVEKLGVRQWRRKLDPNHGRRGNSHPFLTLGSGGGGGGVGGKRGRTTRELVTLVTRHGRMAFRGRFLGSLAMSCILKRYIWKEDLLCGLVR